MLTVTLKDKDSTKLCFNLKNFEREQALLGMWASLKSDTANAEKQLKIQTTQGEVFLLFVGGITTMEFDPSEYVKITAADVHTGRRRH